jgi:enoyl-CoA hydratase/carnithine racemase
VPDDRLLEEATGVAERLAALPPLAVRAMKRVLNETAAVDLRSALTAETRATIDGFMDPETTRLLREF